jgi:hypothetical protein
MRCAACSSSTVLPLMPSWFAHGAAMSVVCVAVTAVVLAATGLVG